MKSKFINGLSKLLLSGAIATTSSSCMNTLDFLAESDCTYVTGNWHPSGPLDTILLKLKYDKGRITEEGLRIRTTYFREKKDQPLDRYHLVARGNTGEKIFSEGFDFTLVVFNDLPEAPLLDYAEITLLVPYRPDEKLIEIYDPNCQKVLSVSIPVEFQQK